MTTKRIFLGDTCLKEANTQVKGGFTEIQGESFYKISHYDQMPDFFMTIVSDSDHWMFISSNGSLSAGRKNRDNALFPYYSVDKIDDFCGITGSKTVLLVEKSDKTYLWEPFSKEFADVYQIQRNLYKSEYGNKIIYEEINHQLDVAFQYAWCNSEKFGFVRKSTVTNLSENNLKIELLDGITNILPCGVDYDFQNEYSNLLNAYKKNELLPETGLGLFMLSSIPVDRAEPSESLNATSVWSYGLANTKILLCIDQLQNFKNGLAVHTETDIRARRGAYLVNAELKLEPHQNQEWMIVSEINQSATDIANLNGFLNNEKSVSEWINSDIRQGTDNLIKLVAGADGMQTGNEALSSARHFSNTLYNIMRGGTYVNNYSVEADDFRQFVRETNKKLSKDFESTLGGIPQTTTIQALTQLAETTDNANLIRISYEYLPLTFSRRHGDPSRPWNLFSIENRNPDGSAKSDYQGNWRDIFQNWEALSLSYPEYIESIISKFVNASTADGYNPYRLMRSGIDWERPDKDDPWAYIGYWGDHQIAYLQSLLELSDKYHPGKIDALLGKEIFAYANVPYRIKPYDDIVNDSQDTVEFDYALDQDISRAVEHNGADGRLIMRAENEVYHVNLTEKILVTLLAKLSNFVPEAGIWLNTQRPEWNDANNALVGNGVSMVTLCYLRRFISFWNEKFSTTSCVGFSISEEVKSLFDNIFKVFSSNSLVLSSGFSDHQRRHFVDALGEAGTVYRNKLYGKSFSGHKENISTEALQAFTRLSLDYIDQSIRVNKRDDGLYHAYNLISFKQDKLSIRNLYEMLEGQVAVLSAGYLSPQESLDVLDGLRNSKLFREDQNSYILYPNRELPRFTQKNNIPENRVKDSKLLSRLIADKNASILSVDDAGVHHFNGSIRNSDLLDEALNALADNGYAELVIEEKNKLLDVYEEMFDHQSFTGRSGTFFEYEGLGSIYWHMVSKLLLAVEQVYFDAVEQNTDAVIEAKLKDHYFEIKAGVGVYKSPELYGAFPTDPYSHTPGGAGAKQPGMTGQVKEDFITRMAELGIKISQGAITFDSRLIDHREFLTSDRSFEFVSVCGENQSVDLKQKQLAFTLCQVPVVYTLADHQKVVVWYNNGDQKEFPGKLLDKQTSRLIFNRENKIKLIEVSIS